VDPDVFRDLHLVFRPVEDMVGRDRQPLLYQPAQGRADVVRPNQYRQDSIPECQFQEPQREQPADNPNNSETGIIDLDLFHRWFSNYSLKDPFRGMRSVNPIKLPRGISKCNVKGDNPAATFCEGRKKWSLWA
jgi:hypothetical protein